MQYGKSKIVPYKGILMFKCLNIKLELKFIVFLHLSLIIFQLLKLKLYMGSDGLLKLIIKNLNIPYKEEETQLDQKIIIHF